VDRGADLSWLSQYPHEKEVLLPPLTGIEALGSDVEGNMLVIESRFSVNLSAQTLEQASIRCCLPQAHTPPLPDTHLWNRSVRPRQHVSFRGMQPPSVVRMHGPS
jgi:hypothetical protein